MSGQKTDVWWFRALLVVVGGSLLAFALGYRLPREPLPTLAAVVGFLLLLVWVRFAKVLHTRRDRDVVIGFVVLCAAPPTYAAVMSSTLQVWVWILYIALFGLLTVHTIDRAWPRIVDWARSAMPPADDNGGNDA